MDIKLNRSSCRIVRGNKLVDVYLQEPIELNNFTSIDNFLEATSTSGIITFATHVTDITLLNKNVGAVVELDVQDESEDVIDVLEYELNFNKTSVQISGSTKIGRF